MNYLSERELASWRVSTRFIRQLRAERRLDFMKLGRRVIYPMDFIERYEREQLVESRTVTLRRNA